MNLNKIQRNFVIRQAFEDIERYPEDKRHELFIIVRETWSELGVHVPTNESLSYLLGDGTIKAVLENTRGYFVA